MNDNVIELSKSTKEEDRHMVTSKKEIIDYGINDLFTRDEYESLLQPLEADILDYRYIVLCRKNDVNDITNNMLSKYLIPYLNIVFYLS